MTPECVPASPGRAHEWVRRFQRQRRVGHPLITLSDAVVLLQRVVRRERDAKTRLSRRTPNLHYS
jgi:hypothetical protein